MFNVLVVGHQELSDMLISEGINVTTTDSLEQADAYLWQGSYDLLIMNLDSPGWEMFLRSIQSNSNNTMLSVIGITTSNQTDILSIAIKQGLDDIFLWPNQISFIIPKMERMMKRIRSFEQMAFRDPLTGVYNRRYFEQFMQMEVHRLQRHPSPCSLAFIDCDRFKSINDTYGHHIGDLVLQGIAQKITKQLRSSDLIARYGGEEFVLVLPHANADDALAKVKEILKNFNEEPTAMHEGEAFFVTFSSGVCEYKPGMTVDEWIQLADHATYQAKREGRNRVILASGNDSIMSTKGGKEKSILLADHQDLTRILMLNHLDGMGYKVIEALDGQTAYDMLHQEDISLVIVDADLPKMNGLDMLSLLKTDSDFKAKQIPVIMIADRRSEHTFIKATMLGVDDFYVRPFSPVLLTQAVQRLL